jgi:integrase
VDVQAAVVEWSQHYAPSTVRIAYSRIATVYKHAVADRLVQFSPCSRISLPNADHARIVPLTAEQVRTIAERVPAWYRSMVLVGAASGLRGGELRGLTVDRVSGDSIRVDRQLVGHNGKVPLFGPPKSEAGVRTVQVDEIAATELVAHLERWPAEDLIWRTRHHSPIDRQDASDVWREATRGMGLRPRSGFHDLRHFHASLLIAAGLSPRAVADRLGHADVAETLRTYSHLWPSDDARAVAATHSMMAAVIGPSVTVTVDPESEATPA